MADPAAMARHAFLHWRRPAAFAGGLAAIVLLLAWLMGAFHHRVPPGPPVAQPSMPIAGERWTVTMQRRRTTEAAVGTVRAIHETVVASRILGRIVTLAIERAGQPVQQGEVLVEIEANDLRAVADQARAAHQVALTHRDKARLDLARTEQLVQQGAAAGDRLDTDRALAAAAEAEVERAVQHVAAADTAVGFATIRAPLGGIVVDKQVQAGDVVQPGQPICTLYDPTRLQLVAVVREELAGRLVVGQEVDVTLEALGKSCRGRVAEIVPAANVASRSFEVKITGPCQPGVVTGMFGRLHIPLDEVDELRIPGRAVRSIGQLDFVDVVVDGRAARRFVRLGTRDGDTVQVLSGLRAGEIIVLPATR
jgi:membrane fusion protein, multidrug efflux system